MHFSQIFRTSKKDERLTELEAQVMRLTEQNTKLAEDAVQAERREQAMEALTGEHGKMLAAKQRLEERLDMAHKHEVEMAEIIVQQKQNIADLENDFRRLVVEEDETKRQYSLLAAENRDLQVEAKHYREHITTLQETCMKLSNEKSVLLDFVRSIEPRSIRPDRGGKELLDRLGVLLERYDKQDDKQMLSE